MEEDEILPEQQLIQKQKRERKELQAQIQVLKKSICKGDKKKKKEVMEEIAYREAELEKKQNEEMTTFKLTQLSIAPSLNVKEDVICNITCGIESNTNLSEEKDSENVEVHEEGPLKVSRAKRRREKKAREEQERNKRIIEQEAENELGKRNVETQAIKKILLERNLILYEIPSDGHCLYNAIAHQLKVIDQTPIGLEELRKKTATYLRENMNDYLPFLSNSDSETLLSPEEFNKYCKNIAETSTWGGAVELQVLSHVLKCPIEVIQATGNPYIIGDEYEEKRKVILTYHRYMYELGAHYNSVTKYEQQTED